jgi:hypothetical protein
MTDYEVGSKIEIPGLDGKFEYGDVETVKFDRIPGAYLINDKSRMERTRLTNISGLHKDPDGIDTRNPHASHHGEQVGQMLYTGRTLGFTGIVEAGSLHRVRDEWRKLKSRFGIGQRDLLVHPPSEVLLYINEITNPVLKYDTTGWISSTASGTPGTFAGGVSDGLLTVGQFPVTSIAAGSQSGPYVTFMLSDEWNGEDVFVSIAVKAHIAASAVQGFDLEVLADGGTFGSTLYIAAQQSSPATATWYVISGKVLASTIRPQTRQVGIGVRMRTNAAGDYTMRFSRAMLILLSPTMANPPGYFDGDVGGHEWDGISHQSRSRGPCYSVNKIWDPEFAYPTSITNPVLLTWSGWGLAGITIDQDPILNKNWSGNYTNSTYIKMTKDNNTTSRNMSLLSYSAGSGSGNYYQDVSAGRTYRWSCRVNPIARPNTGTLKIRISWYTAAPSLISTSDGIEINTIGDFSIEAIAPVGAVLAMPSVDLDATTTALGALELAVADPCFIDISSFDPGDFFGLESSIEIPAVPSQGVRSRHIIPRPWLIRNTRKVPGDLDAPELQKDSRFARDFSFALRASDPRIYQLDERRREGKLAGTSQLVGIQSPTGFTVDTASLPVPSGYTYEGHYVTHPGTGTVYIWSRSAVNRSAPDTSVLPSGGVGIRNWNSSGSQGLNRPTSDLLTRVYRSSEGFTYTNPKVILGCSPSSFGRTSSSTWPDDMLGWNWISDASADLVYVNHAAILLKRVSSTTWLELRWNGIRKDHIQQSTVDPWGNAVDAGVITGAPYSLELWCSHNTSGTLATTRLNGVDLTTTWTGGFPFKPSVQPYYLVSWMISNIVYWELWSSYPSLLDFSNRIESGSYTLSANLIALMGSAVSGSTGWSLKIPKANNDSSWQSLASRPPFIHYFESIKAEIAPVTLACPVIGDFEDSPQKIILSGDLVDPIISISVPDFDDEPAATSVAYFSGTAENLNPIIIDLNDGSIMNSTGTNVYSMLIPGSRFIKFRPGVNYVTVQAKNFATTVTAHVVASWRDARR